MGDGSLARDVCEGQVSDRWAGEPQRRREVYCKINALWQVLGFRIKAWLFQSVQAQAASEPCGNGAHLPVGAPNFPAEEAEQLEDF